ncbi:MAG: hypothetical protein L6E13_04640 [Firmicutes bacterium]|nr:hypothetical protein [Bacillota bacterium]
MPAGPGAGLRPDHRRGGSPGDPVRPPGD